LCALGVRVSTGETAVKTAPNPTSQDLTRRIASLNDAAHYSGVCTRTLRRYIAEGRLTGYRIGPRLLRVDLDEIDDRLLLAIPTAGGDVA